MRYVVSILVLCAAPALAQEADPADVAAMTKAIEEAGCVVTAENGDAVLAASGLDENQTMAVIAAMYAAGTVDLQPEGVMTLTSAACP